jgi:threonine dehydrogenase-like Zn-dependent dehydrogenase
MTDVTGMSGSSSTRRTMRRLAKGEGYGNVFFEEVPLPPVASNQVLVKTHTSLISRGSEILRRYRLDGTVPPSMMGYATSATVVEAGEDARAAGFLPGARVYASAPHAEYSVLDAENDARLLKMPDAMPWDRIPFVGFARAGLAWVISSRAQPGDTVVILGQGLIGNVVMQAHRMRGAGRVITVDTLGLRLRLSRELGAEEVIDGSKVDAVAEVKRLTGGRGADVVVDCVGGPPGVQSFAQALDMVKRDGIIHQIGLYHGQPLPLDSGKIQGKLLIGGYRLDESLGALNARGAELLQAGRFRTDPLITHRLPASEAPQAFAMLDQHIDQAFGVLLEWPQDE